MTAKITTLEQLRTSITQAKNFIANAIITITEAFTEHVEDTTVDEETGAHGLRYYDGKLQYYNDDGENGEWVTINIADLLI